MIDEALCDDTDKTGARWHSAVICDCCFGRGLDTEPSIRAALSANADL